MMNHQDDKIEEFLKEQFLDQGSAFTSADREMYRLLLSELVQEPDASLPLNFSTKLNLRLKEELTRKDEIRFYLYLILFFLSCLIGIISTMMIIDQNYKSTLLISMSEYKWIFLFIVTFIFCVQFIDGKLVSSTTKAMRQDV